MKTVPATALRRSLFATLKRVAYEREPVLIERRGRPIAALVPPETVTSPTAAAAAPVSNRPLLDPRAIADFCARHQVRALYLFGSVMGDDFGSDSDIDVMFEAAGEGPSYFEQMDMTEELQTMFGRPVDLVSRRAVEAMSNPFRRKGILDGARVIYALP
jgi:prevent-host-death family protein